MKLGLQLAGIGKPMLHDGKTRPLILLTLLNAYNGRVDGCSRAVFQENMGKGLYYFGRRNGALLQVRATVRVQFHSFMAR